MRLHVCFPRPSRFFGWPPPPPPRSDHAPSAPGHCTSRQRCRLAKASAMLAIFTNLSSTELSSVFLSGQTFNDYDSTTASRLLSDYEAGYGSTYVAWANSSGSFSSSGPDVTASGTYVRIDGPRVSPSHRRRSLAGKAPSGAAAVTHTARPAQPRVCLLKRTCQHLESSPCKVLEIDF